MVKITVYVSILVLMIALAESSPFCCTQYNEKPVPVKMLKYYIIQEDTDYCNIRAVIFKTRRRPLCANPESKWVQMAMQSVPRKQ